MESKSFGHAVYEAQYKQLSFSQVFKTRTRVSMTEIAGFRFPVIKVT